jgi:hypothetical protein
MLQKIITRTECIGFILAANIRCISSTAVMPSGECTRFILPSPCSQGTNYEKKFKNSLFAQGRLIHAEECECVLPILDGCCVERYGQRLTNGRTCGLDGAGDTRTSRHGEEADCGGNYHDINLCLVYGKSPKPINHHRKPVMVLLGYS